MNIHDIVLFIVELAEEVACKNENRREVGDHTAIQKLAYFTKQICKDLEMPEFQSHFYGPYCPDVGMALEDLMAYCFVYEKKIPGRRFNAYRYMVDDDGKFITKHVRDKDGDHYEKIKEIVTKCNEVCHLEPKPLTYAAKLHHILSKSEKNISADELYTLGEELRWESEPEDIKRGINLLRKLEMMG